MYFIGFKSIQVCIRKQTMLALTEWNRINASSFDMFEYISALPEGTI